VKNLDSGLPNCSRKVPQGKTASNPEYLRLIKSVQRIATIKNPIERRFELNRVAPTHDLPRAECRSMIEQWFLEGAQ
jgi:hypothetical protein